ncbi:MAG TPA: transglutaminase-like domain-containing protein [Rhodopila sp.]|jgi:regulator of sirC expression with transglutaminase-like and TPR domain|nr:transglutaminase-like domain-containing protein [Rhodopila sp.]
MSDPRLALEAIGQLPDAEIDIGDAALQLARIDAPSADWRAAHHHLSELAKSAVQMSTPLTGAGIQDKAEALADVLVGAFKYRGDLETYDDLANANLIRVIERRRGLPVALGILWLHAARAAGWACHGIDFPAHFLIALEDGDKQVALDVFIGGQVMTTQDLLGLLRRVEGPDANLRPGLLQPMTNRRILLRLQNNIMTRRLQAGDMLGGLACIEDMLRIAPDQPELWRQSGVMNQKLDRIAAAVACYTRFLDLVPNGSAANAVRAQLEILRSSLN